MQIRLCKCDCGNEKIISGHCLRTGNTKSCGCLQKEIVGKQRRLEPGLANMRDMIRNYKNGAKRRGLECNLTEKQFAELTQKDCYYCGAKPSNVTNHKNYNGAYIYNGLDRVDNNKGYAIDNVVPCCRVCNFRKRDAGFQEFKEWINKVYINLNGKPIKGNIKYASI